MKKLTIAIAFSFPLLTQAANPVLEGQEKAGVCVACHGQKGVSVNPQWPNLAGQHPLYLSKQLKDLKEQKKRNNPTMTAILSTLSEQDIEDLAAYYASLPRTEGSTAKRYLARGERLYRGGDLSRGITACIACHGPRGHGNAQAGFPVLSGQQAGYTVAQLEAFKKKERRNDLNGIMQAIAARMSHRDMEAVAYYMQGLY